jgi:hypothetical protein
MAGLKQMSKSRHRCGAHGQRTVILATRLVCRAANLPGENTPSSKHMIDSHTALCTPLQLTWNEVSLGWLNTSNRTVDVLSPAIGVTFETVLDVRSCQAIIESFIWQQHVIDLASPDHLSGIHGCRFFTNHQKVGSGTNDMLRNQYQHKAIATHCFREGWHVDLHHQAAIWKVSIVPQRLPRGRSRSINQAR